MVEIADVKKILHDNEKKMEKAIEVTRRELVKLVTERIGG